jgi:hypothetical protein
MQEEGDQGSARSRSRWSGAKTELDYFLKKFTVETANARDEGK